jgi:hypothetical protein
MEQTTSREEQKRAEEEQGGAVFAGEQSGGRRLLDRMVGTYRSGASIPGVLTQQRQAFGHVSSTGVTTYLVNSGIQLDFRNNHF